MRILQRRWWIIVVCALLTPAAAYALSNSQAKQYSADASLLFRDPGFNQGLLGTAPPATDPAREAATNLKLVSLGVVADRTSRAMGGTPTSAQISQKIAVAEQGDSSLISLTATDHSPAIAARLANEFARQFIAFRRQADRSKVQEALNLTRQRIKQLDPRVRASTRGRLLQDRSDQLETLASLQTGNAELVQPADVPDSPSSPKPFRDAAIGFALGLVLGLALAFLFHRFDRRIRDAQEIAETFDRPILSAIPESRELATAGVGSTRIAVREAEAFRMLRANLRYFNVDRPIHSVLVTSAAPGDGKSTVASNLAAATAAAGARTLLIEADLRHPTLARALQINPGVGLTNVLAGDSRIPDVIQKVDVAEGRNGHQPRRTMDVVVAGPLPPNPVDLIESDRMREVLRQAETRYDLVVVDTPPTAVVSDAIPLVTQVSGVIVVGRIGKSTRDAIGHLHSQLENLQAPTLGVVVNSVTKRGGGYGYYGGYAYGYKYGGPAAEAAVSGNGAAQEQPTAAGGDNGSERSGLFARLRRSS